MMVKAYVLVVTDPGRTKGVVNTLRDIPEVIGSHQAMEPYNVVVEIQVENLTDIPPILGEEIRKIPRIQSTTSLITLPT
jgi:DNA-binding Lrp family transcriptional regulator